MPHPLRRAIRRWSLARNARRYPSPERTEHKLSRDVRTSYQTIRNNLNTPQSNQVARREFGHLEQRKKRFAIIEAFRAARIFGNETRNELIHLRSWVEIEKRIGKKRMIVFRNAYKRALEAAGEAEIQLFVQNEAEQVKKGSTPAQLPVHGRVVQGRFGRQARKKAA